MSHLGQIQRGEKKNLFCAQSAKPQQRREQLVSIQTNRQKDIGVVPAQSVKAYNDKAVVNCIPGSVHGMKVKFLFRVFSLFDYFSVFFFFFFGYDNLFLVISFEIIAYCGTYNLGGGEWVWCRSANTRLSSMFNLWICRYICVLVPCLLRWNKAVQNRRQLRSHVLPMV